MIRRGSTSCEATKTNCQFKIASLFSGIGGFELGFQRAGHETVLACEIDPAASAVLRARFPGVTIHDDIRKIKSLPKDVDVLTAGFPCQDLSQAGRTEGIFGKNSGLVWEVFRLLKTASPSYVVFENVPFMLRLDKGRAIDAIASQLEMEGFKWAYRTIDPRSFGIPQRRPRVFMVASKEHDPRNVLFCKINTPKISQSAGSFGFYWTEGNRGIGWAVNSLPALKGGSGLGIPSAPALILPGGLIVTPHLNDAERLQGFPPSWTSPAIEVDPRAGARWRLIGNAVNVRVAQWIGEKLAQPATFCEIEELQFSGAPWPTAAYNVSGNRMIFKESENQTSKVSPTLHEFLRFKPKPLSYRAASGVLKRLKASKLKPEKILMDSLEQHVANHA